ncbi:hypothetical protein [Phaffia rhodozyma]|uniref:Uncharacterized protein n=1 Tax=Phaffia rhodozyma TaxID=264483 RepID=A0A0F7ST18_PHARH|nr:hypothetical protein [Phaffia rhodozyma]
MPLVPIPSHVLKQCALLAGGSFYASYHLTKSVHQSIPETISEAGPSRMVRAVMSALPVVVVSDRVDLSGFGRVDDAEWVCRAPWFVD